jgi:hypothetical protein
MDDSANLIFDAIGMTGVFFYITAYAALQAGFLKGGGYTYTIMNLIAASLVLVSLTNNFNLSSAIIQITWIVISVFGLTRYFILHHSTRLTPEEAAFARSKLPTIPKPLVRNFFQSGSWVDLEPGTIIATEGKELGALIYLLLGEAEVENGKQPVGLVGSDSFIGELTCFDGGTATATVTATSPTRVFRIPAATLIKLCSRNPEFRIEIERSIRKDTGLKLVAANARISGKEIGQ